jgi:hypothetical protein
MNPKYFLTAAIVLSSTCATNTDARQMTHESNQEVIREIYQDSFYSLPQNRHKRDELIKKILTEQNEANEKIKQQKSPD